MKLREVVDIDAPAEDVWPFIANPERMAAWHEKLLSVTRSALGTVRLGDRFDATYTMSGRQRPTSAEVVRCQPPIALTLRHRLSKLGPERFVDESYDLLPQGNATRLEQVVDFARAGLPLWARGLMWFISRFGTRTGESLLAPLKRAVEGTSGQDYASSGE
jgi:uncharacterized protein YndB with AHSA1/START domain